MWAYKLLVYSSSGVMDSRKRSRSSSRNSSYSSSVSPFCSVIHMCMRRSVIKVLRGGALYVVDDAVYVEFSLEELFEVLAV